MLVILDGWGLGQDPSRSAIAQGDTPFFDQLMSEFPNSQLLTHGENVGLPEGQMGNSEVGHLNIGAGRIVYQDLVLINKAISEGRLSENETLSELIEKAKLAARPIHVMGLLSDGGVHSHIDHLKGLLYHLVHSGLSNIHVHAFLDGRDTDPKGGLGYVKSLMAHIEGTPVRLSSIIGRYYAMDRDKRWERTQKAYDLLVRGEGDRTFDILAYLKSKYDEGVTDEFMSPVIIESEGHAFEKLKDEDFVLFFNYRTDRPRQLTEVLTQKAHPNQGMHPLQLNYYTMTQYDSNFKGLNILFDKRKLTSTLGEAVSRAGLSQLRAAETEKYPHVTYFLNGGAEEVFENEDRILIPSPKVATYDLKPSMSAQELTDEVLKAIQVSTPDCIVINYANPDMVGHTGDFEAAKAAVTFVDTCLRRLVESAMDKAYKIVIIADHGNADYMINEDGSPNTAHSTNPVPCIILGAGHVNPRNGILADVAPTLLDLMNVPQPEAMTGKSLISKD